MLRQSRLHRRQKKSHRKSQEWQVEPVTSAEFQPLENLDGREIASLLASAYGRIRALEVQVAELRK